MTLPLPNLSTSRTQLAAKRSLWHLYTWHLPSWRRSKNLDSSLNQTRLQRCWGHTHHWRRRRRCCCVKMTPRTGRLAWRPASRRRFRTVWSDIPRTPGNAVAVEVAVVVLSRRWRTRMYRSWAAVVTRGLLDLGRSRVDPCCWYRSHSLVIVLGDTLNALATANLPSPACKRPTALFLCASLSRGISFWFCSRLGIEVRQSKTPQFYTGRVHVARVSNAHAWTTWFAPGRVLAILHVFDWHFQVYAFMRLLQWGCVWDPEWHYIHKSCSAQSTILLFINDFIHFAFLFLKSIFVKPTDKHWLVFTRLVVIPGTARPA